MLFKDVFARFKAVPSEELGEALFAVRDRVVREGIFTTMKGKSKIPGGKRYLNDQRRDPSL
jgi:hypothetical protein